jgi:hypothetical protein
MEKPIRAFLWASTRGRRKYHLVPWRIVCIPKTKGGLGLKNLRRFNVSLMCKWWWKLEHDSGPWQKFMWKKYLENSCVFSARHRPHESPLWTNMLKVKDLYLSGRSMNVRNGRRTHFWGDKCCGEIPFKDKFPGLYAICNEQDIIVHDAAQKDWHFDYRRQLAPDIQIQLVRMRIMLDPIRLSDEEDIPIWDWTKNAQFSVKSVYKDLSSFGIDRSFKHLWKAKIPLKIKIWLWLIWHNSIPTKDTMIERGWLGNSKCQICDQNETIHHLFFSCPAAKFV